MSATREAGDRSGASASESPVRITTVDAGTRLERTDVLAIEEPLELRLKTQHGFETITLTMRTPGHDLDLALGFLFAEGVIRSSRDIHRIAHADDLERPERDNVVQVELRRGLEPDLDAIRRLHATSSACGVCGTASLEMLRSRQRPIVSGARLAASTVCSLPEKLRPAQGIFDSTGGLHASALFDSAGELLAVREDIGRHNALDKLVGHALLEAWDLENGIALVSGRVGFEIAQKCIAARIPFLCAVGAPSSLAVTLALEFDLTLIGFLRGERFNVYSGIERIT